MSDNLIERLGIQDAVGDESNPSSDAVIRELFELAASKGVPVCLLRLGAPRPFRDEIIRMTEPDGKLSHAFQLLLDRRVPAIEFVIASPKDAAFLNRMDTEQKPLDEIWRVRRNMLAFVRGLLRANQIRVQNDSRPILIAFHSKPLIWNFGSAGLERVVIRAYFGETSGHDDEVTEVVLQGGAQARLAESMLAYYSAIRNDTTTMMIDEESDLQNFQDWPSLFKGNAVWRDDTDAETPEVVKVVSSKSVHHFEAMWSQSRDRAGKECRFFRPARLANASFVSPKTAGGFALKLQAVDGPTAEQLLFQLQLAASTPSLSHPNLQLAANLIVRQAMHALQEFHQRAEMLRFQEAPAIYPWREKLVSALHEASPFVTTNRRLIGSLIDLFQEIGAHLESKAGLPFRDAHLKNRLIAVPDKIDWRDPAQLAGWLGHFAEDDLAQWFEKNTFDIDFETTRYRTTACDDAMHILCSPNIGWKPNRLTRDSCRQIRTWWHDDESLELTLLCRSFRELCRRIWYANVMPNAYRDRYSIEPREHFLQIAELIAQRSLDWLPLTEFLQICRLRAAAIWRAPEPPRVEQKIVVDSSPQEVPHPPRLDGQINVFISSHHADYEHAHRLYEYLKRNGIAAFFCERNDGEQRDANFANRINTALTQCRHLVIVASNSKHVGSRWVSTEWQTYLNLLNSGQKANGNLLTVTVGNVAITELPVMLQSYAAIPLENAIAGTILPYIA